MTSPNSSSHNHTNNSEPTENTHNSHPPEEEEEEDEVALPTEAIPPNHVENQDNAPAPDQPESSHRGYFREILSRHPLMIRTPRKRVHPPRERIIFSVPQPASPTPPQSPTPTQPPSPLHHPPALDTTPVNIEQQLRDFHVRVMREVHTLLTHRDSHISRVQTSLRTHEHFTENRIRMLETRYENMQGDMYADRAATRIFQRNYSEVYRYGCMFAVVTSILVLAMLLARMM